MKNADNAPFNLVEAIAERARLHPAQPALVTDREQVTYGELESRAAQLANHLKTLGAAREVLIAICLERSPEFVVAALAILQCGAAYLPMEPANPPARLRFIAQDSGAHLLITNEKFASIFADSKLRVVDLAAEQEIIARQPVTSPQIEPNADDLAYVIYTSGSTGQPKGVEILQRNLANLITWHVRAFAIDFETRATFQAGVGFDAAVWEIWPALSVGAQLHLPNEETRALPEALRDWLVVRQIQLSFVSTAIAEQLLALPWPNETKLRFLLTGADTLHRFPPGNLPFAFVNNYGPTECTVVATSAIVPPEGAGIPTIGAPIDHVLVRLVDDEIYLGGAGLARGYRNRPELTNEYFVNENGQRWYRTGDLGRLLPNGEISFLGRRDDQIKIRGHRIELNEIAAALKQHSSIRAAVAILREDSPNEKKLVAYVVPSTSFYDETQLRESLAQRLPDYMLPNAFVWLDELPLTANGKIDRAALPPPGVNENEFVAPRNDLEKTLAGLIAEVLKIPRLSVQDDIFHLGAHSLLGAQIIARVREVFGADLKLLDVFDAPTVAELAVKIEDALTAQLETMSEAEVEAALANLDRADVAG